MRDGVHCLLPLTGLVCIGPLTEETEEMSTDITKKKRVECTLGSHLSLMLTGRSRSSRSSMGRGSGRPHPDMSAPTGAS